MGAEAKQMCESFLFNNNPHKSQTLSDFCRSMATTLFKRERLYMKGRAFASIARHVVQGPTSVLALYNLTDYLDFPKNKWGGGGVLWCIEWLLKTVGTLSKVPCMYWICNCGDSTFRLLHSIWQAVLKIQGCWRSEMHRISCIKW